MADNITLNAGSGGSTVKTDDDGTAHWQYVKLAYGADNTQTRVTATNPLPVDIYSGTIDVMLGTDFSAVLGTSNIVATDGSAALTLGLHALGTDGTNAQIISTNTTGHVNIADGGNSITVDGTVTANLSATDNTVLDNIQTAVELIDDAVYVDDADWTDSTSKHVLTGGVYQSAPQTITDGDVGPFQVTANGYLITSVNGTVTVDGSGVTQPVSGTVTANLGATDNAVLDSIDTAVNLIDDAVYTDATGTPSKGLAVMGTDGTNPQIVSVDASGHLQVDVLSGAGGGTQYATDDALGTTPTGTVALAARDDALSTLTPVEGDAIHLRTNNRGALWVKHDSTLDVTQSGLWEVDLGSNNDVTIGGSLSPLGTTTYSEGVTSGLIVAPAFRNDTMASLVSTDNELAPLQVNSSGALYTQTTPHTSGGCSVSRDLSCTDTLNDAKASACNVYGVFVTNSNAAVRYLKLFNEQGVNVTLGVDTPVMTIPIPPSDSGVYLSFPHGIEFSTACSYACTTEQGDAGTTGAAANEVVAHVFYK